MALLSCLRHPVAFSRAAALAAAFAWLALPGQVGAGPAAQTQEQESGVSITAFTFEPAAVTINAGQSVTWSNADGVPHTSTALNRLWGDVLTTGDTFAYTFDNPGTYAYFCEIHPAMVGTITVTAE